MGDRDELLELRRLEELETRAGSSVPQAVHPQHASAFDKALGSAYGRLQLGVVTPALGIGQLGAHALDTIAGTDYGRHVDETIRKIEAGKKRGMAARGHDPESTDWMGMLGFGGPGAGIAKGVAKVLPAAVGPLGRAGVAAIQSGAVGASAPTKGEDFGGEKTGQAAASAALGGLFSLGSDLIRNVGRGVKSMIPYFTKKGHEELANRVVVEKVGKDHMRKVVAAALAAESRLPAHAPGPGAQGPTLPGSPMTVAEAVSHIPEGSPLQALEKLTFTTPGGPSKLGGELARQALAAQGAAKADVEATLGPLREALLKQADIAGREVPKLTKAGAKAERMLGKALKEQASFQPKMVEPPPGTLRSAVDIHRHPIPDIPLRTAAEKSRIEMLPEVIARRQQEMERVRQGLAALNAQGLQPLKAAPIIRSIKEASGAPGPRVSDVVRKTLGHIEDKLESMKDNHGVVDAFDLYMVRKEAGNVIRKFADEDKNFDQRLAGGLLNNIQDKIDEAIEAAGGKGWRENYMRPYAKGMGNITADRESKEAMYKPLQKTMLQGGAALAKGAIPFEGGPPILQRAWTAAKWLPRARAEVIEPRLDAYLAEIFSDSKTFGRVMTDHLAKEQQTEQRRKLVDALMRWSPVAAGVAGSQVGR